MPVFNQSEEFDSSTVEFKTLYYRQCGGKKIRKLKNKKIEKNNKKIKEFENKTKKSKSEKINWKFRRLLKIQN